MTDSGKAPHDPRPSKLIVKGAVKTRAQIKAEKDTAAEH